MEILQHHGDAFEEASIDEAYLDLSSVENLATARETVSRIKHEIREREGLGCSVGVGPNKLIAKIASGQQKPDGLTVVKPEEIGDFLDPLPIRVIPGIGPKTAQLLHAKNLERLPICAGFRSPVSSSGLASGARNCLKRMSSRRYNLQISNGLLDFRQIAR